jgi:uncharacterized protein (DUF58 family)
MIRHPWLVFLGFFLLIGILLQVSWLMYFSITILVIYSLAYLWKINALRGVTYQRSLHFTRGFPGETTRVKLQIENQKLLPVPWLRSQDTWPRAVGPEDEEILAPHHIQDQGYLTNLFSLRWYERTRREYTLLLRKRGVYTIGPVELASGDLFGIHEEHKTSTTRDVVTIFPAFITTQKLNLFPEDPMGELRTRRKIFEDTSRPMGIRDHHPEDGFRKIHWPATARTGQLQTKVYQPTSGRVMVICLNVSTFEKHWEGVYAPLLEYLISVAATVINDGMQAGYQVGLLANGCIALSDQPFRIPPGRTPRHLATLLSALAGVNSVVTASFERYLLREAPRIPFGGTLVVVSAVFTPQLAEAMLQLKKRERKITLLAVTDRMPDPIPGITIIHLPHIEHLPAESSLNQP